MTWKCRPRHAMVPRTWIQCCISVRWERRLYRSMYSSRTQRTSRSSILTSCCTRTGGATARPSRRCLTPQPRSTLRSTPAARHTIRSCRPRSRRWAALTMPTWRRFLTSRPSPPVGLQRTSTARRCCLPRKTFSNGDIGTVDVLYPDAPIYLFFNPALLEAQVVPVLRYATLPRWKFPFAPHDLGRWPIANGQGVRRRGAHRGRPDAGGRVGRSDSSGRRTCADRGQPAPCAPVLAAVHQVGRVSAQGRYGTPPISFRQTTSPATWPTMRIFPPRQSWPLGAYADMAKRLGHEDVAHTYRTLAEGMATKWQTMANEGGDHTVLAFDKPGTWSQKYNLVWDQILGLHLFPAKVPRQ